MTGELEPGKSGYDVIKSIVVARCAVVITAVTDRLSAMPHRSPENPLSSSCLRANSRT